MLMLRNVDTKVSSAWLTSTNVLSKQISKMNHKKSIYSEENVHLHIFTILEELFMTLSSFFWIF